MSGIVRSPHELPAGTGRLECPGCNRRIDIEHIKDLGDPLRCIDCLTVGLIPRRHDRIADKYPGRLGDHFATIPHKLLDPDNSLDLDRNELVVIIVLERFRWRYDDLVYPSQELIARMARISRRTVQRVLDGLIGDGLILVRHDSRTGHLRRNLYDLSPIWDCLARDAPRPFGKPRGVRVARREASW
jgi:DNA-binding MarR family transcriptional regulator